MYTTPANALRVLLTSLVLGFGLTTDGRAGELGSNLAPVSPVSTQWAFVDVFRQASEWIPQLPGPSGPWDTGVPLALDADGWPLLATGQAAGAVLENNGGLYPAGLYLCTYDGIGTIEFHLDATVTVSQPGSAIVAVTPSNLIHVKIVASSTADPIRNIRLYMPDYWNDADVQRFHPLFIERLEPYGVLRFMDWQRTNNSTLVNWSDRTTLNSPTQAGPDGVAIEHIVALANATGSDPWICVPHLANDAFVSQLATLLEAQLDPELSVYVEYSNECWNSFFSQADYCEAQGLALGLASDPNEARVRYYSQRAVEVFSIFESTFGGTDRLVRVLSGQLANPWIAETALSHGTAALHVDALAVNPYIGNSLGTPPSPVDSTWTVDDVLAALSADVAQIAPWIETHADLADSHGLQLIAYEGGQHLVGVGPLQTDPDLASLFQAANRDPGMGTVYEQLLSTWTDQGGGLFVHYHAIDSYSQFGSWGALEHQQQDPATAPKYTALLEYGSHRNFRRGDCSADNTFDVTDPIVLLAVLFTGGLEPDCWDACDTNDDGVVDLSDAAFALASLFQSITPPPPPGLDCSVDPTDDGLDCVVGTCP